MAARAGWKPHLWWPTKSTESSTGPPCQTSHTHIFGEGWIISQKEWGCGAVLQKQPAATRDRYRIRRLAVASGRKARHDLEVPLSTALSAWFMTPKVKQSSPVHLRRHKLMKRMHYLLLQEQNPEQKQRFRVKKKKNTENSKSKGGGDFFSSSLLFHSSTPSLTPSKILAGIKDHGSETGNVSGWGREAVLTL